MRRLSEAEKADVWDGLERGESMRAIGRRLGRAHGSIRTFVAACAGKRPCTLSQSLLRLRLEEREEVSRGLAAGESLRGDRWSCWSGAVDDQPGGGRQWRSGAGIEH